MRRSEQPDMVMQNPPIQNPPTYVGSYRARRFGLAMNWGTPFLESFVSKSLIFKIGLLQVVDFHDSFRYFQVHHRQNTPSYRNHYNSICRDTFAENKKKVRR